MKTPVTTTLLYNQPHHVTISTTDFDIVQPIEEPTSPIPSPSSPSTLSTIEDKDWKRQFQKLLSDMITYSGELEIMSLEQLKMEIKVRELILLEKMLTEYYEQQEQDYINQLREIQQVYQQQAKLIQQMSDFNLDLIQQRTKNMQFTIGTGHVLHSFENPTKEREYIIAGSGTTINHLDIHKHQYILHINHHDRTTKFTLLPKYLWTPDHQSKVCQFNSCLTRFTLFNRRHHCRR